MNQSIKFLGAIAAFATLPLWAFAQDITPDEFIAKAATSNLFEIQSSTLALQLAQSPDVKAFADTMVTDHTKIGDALKKAAGQTPVPDDMTPDQAAMVETLKGSRGADFDAAYVDMQSKAHSEAVALFSAYSTQGSNGPLKTFAADTLPMLQHHQEAVQKLTAR